MSIDPSAYTSAQVFASEIGQLFAERFYVGTVDEFAQPDSFKSFRLGDRSFTVRRTEAGIRCFSNVCLHRCATIDPAGAGQRPFRCGYHGWAYGADGEVRSSPLADAGSIRNTSLKQFPVIEFGDLVFVALNGVVPDLGQLAPALAHTGVPASGSTSFYGSHLTQECNWKLLVENGIESYHLSFVHPQSFLPAGFNSTSMYEWRHLDYTCWSSCTPGAHTSKQAQLRKIAPEATHDFRHAYIFPNLFITTTNQLVGFRSFMVPLSPHRTMLHWELFELPALLRLRPVVREQIRTEAIRFTTASLLEDKPLVEACQVGLCSADAQIQLQPIEDRIQRFHEYYKGRLANA